MSTNNTKIDTKINSKINIKIDTNIDINIDTDIDADTVYTGYFARMKDYIKAGFTKFISISVYQPKFVIGQSQIKKCIAYTDSLGRSINLMPDKNELLLMKKEENIARYINRYGLVLAQYKVEDIWEAFHGGILLCYEKYDNFCHRHLISMWLKSFGYKSEEFIINSSKDVSKNVSKESFKESSKVYIENDILTL